MLQNSFGHPRCMQIKTATLEATSCYRSNLLKGCSEQAKPWKSKVIKETLCKNLERAAKVAVGASSWLAPACA